MKKKIPKLKERKIEQSKMMNYNTNIQQQQIGRSSKYEVKKHWLALPLACYIDKSSEELRISWGRKKCLANKEISEREFGRKEMSSRV